MGIRAIALPLLLAAIPAAGQEYNNPVAKGKREVESLERSYNETKQLIEKVRAEIKADSTGFYKAHESDCQVKGPKRADGSFDYIYKPAIEWVDRRKRLARILTEKAQDLVPLYDKAIADLERQLERLPRRADIWRESIVRLNKYRGDLKAEQEEWKKIRNYALWDSLNSLTSLVLEVNDKRLRGILKDAGLKLKPKEFEELKWRAEKLNEASSTLLKGLRTYSDGAGEPDMRGFEVPFKTAKECQESIAELLARLPGTAEVEEVKTSVRAAFTACSAIYSGANAQARGWADEKTRGEFADTVHDLGKLAGRFWPPAKVAVGVEELAEAGLEAIIAQGALNDINFGVKANEQGLETAKARLQSLNADMENLARILEVYRKDRAELAAKSWK